MRDIKRTLIETDEKAHAYARAQTLGAGGIAVGQRDMRQIAHALTFWREQTEALLHQVLGAAADQQIRLLHRSYIEDLQTDLTLASPTLSAAGT
jgi:hypothetical protein